MMAADGPTDAWKAFEALQERINQNIRDLAAATATPPMFIEEEYPVVVHDEYGRELYRIGGQVSAYEAVVAAKEELDLLPFGLKQRPGDQPLPVVNDEPDVQSQVIADIKERRLVGIQRYGMALQPHNGRDALQDAYEEAIDLAMYLKQLILERDNPPKETHS